MVGLKWNRFREKLILNSKVIIMFQLEGNIIVFRGSKIVPNFKKLYCPIAT